MAGSRRIGPTLHPDRSRVLLRPYYPSSDDIALRIVARVLALSDEAVTQRLSQVLDEFEDRHERVADILRNRFLAVRHHLGEAWEPSAERQALIGAHFTHEYSPESAALFNPSIVPHPDQSGLPNGALRFILSLRAVGEGHISSITFRTGIASAQHRITLSPPVPFSAEPERVPNATYEKALFIRKLQEAGVLNDFCQRVMDQLPDAFILDDLQRVEKAIVRIARIGAGREAARNRAERSGVHLSRPAINIVSALHASGPMRLSRLSDLTDLSVQR